MTNTTNEDYINGVRQGKEIKFKNGLFTTLDMGTLVPAHEIQIGTLLLYSNNRYFEVDDIVREFISDEVAALYPHDVKDEDINPEHYTITFVDGFMNTITKVPAVHLISIAFLYEE
jgi:hypothetical protein